MAWRRALSHVGCWMAALLLRVLGSTWRVRMEGEDPFASAGPFLGAFWHETILAAAPIFRDHGIATMVSESRDGELITKVMTAIGHPRPVRGSTSRGGARGLRQLVKRIEQGGSVGLHLDGPRGPARVVQLGTLLLAKRSCIPIWPIAIAARPCIRFSSWDRMFLPLPFARVTCRVGRPVEVPAAARKEDFAACATHLQTEMDSVTAAAEAGQEPGPQ